MPLLTITYNGFHGRVTKRVRGTCIQVSDRWNVKVSKSGAKRFQCPHKDCQCGEGMPESFELPLSAVYVGLIEVTGNYPQA